jgi:PAS domain S-box-containing protein
MKNSRTVVAGLLTLGLGALLAVAGAAWQAQHNEREASTAFDALSHRVTAELSARIRTYQNGVRGARGAVASAEGARIWRDAFQRYAATRDPDREFPGVRGFGVIWRVAQRDEATFVAAARRDGWPDFSVRQLAPHDGERYVIQYIEPVDRNRAAVGLDIASETRRRQAADAAMRSGEVTLTEPITLVQATGKPQRSFLLLMPIYRPGAPLDSVSAREAAAIGWAYAPLVIDEVVKATSGTDYTLALRDASAAEPEPFYRSTANDAAQVTDLQRRIELPLFGRVWEAEVRATPTFVSALDQTPPRQVAALIMAFAGLCALLVMSYVQLRSRARSEQVEQARRAAIMSSSDDAIIGADLQGVITDWNGGAERLFGHAAAHAIGRNVEALLVPLHLQSEAARMARTAADEQRVAPFDTQRLHRDGSLIDVSVTAAPIHDGQGRCIGYAKAIRDTRAIREAQRALQALNATLEQQVAERTAGLNAAMHDLTAVLDAVPSMIGYWDSDLVNGMANRACSKWFGVDPEQLQGKHMAEVLGEALFERNRPFVEAALRGEPQQFEREIPRPDGQGVRHSLANYVPDVVEGEVRGFYVLVHDVTDLVEGQRHLAAAQRETEGLLRTLHQHNIVSVTDRGGRIIEVNEAFCAISGYSREELIGQDHRIVNSGRQAPGFWTDMWRTVSKGVSWRAEVCNRAKDGSLYWVSSIVAPFVDAQGKVEKYISIRSDITAAKLSEERLRASEAFLDRAGQIAGVGGWEVDLRQQTVHWSAQTRRIHEVASDYVPQLAEGIAFYAPSAQPVIQAAVDDAMKRGTAWDLELPFITAKGRALWVRSVGTVETEGGHPVRLIGAFQDITERKQAEQSLQRERQLMTSLLNTLPDQIYFKDRDSRFLRINPALARLFGLADPAEAIGKSDADFFSPAYASRTADAECKIVESGEPMVDLEEHALWHDQLPTWNLTTKMPLRDVDGQIIGTFGISRDITARRQMEATLQDTNDRFLLAAGSVGMGVWEYDLAAGSLVWDDRMYELYGRSPSGGEAPYTLWSENLHPDDRARSESELQAAIEGSRPFDTTFRVRLPDGTVRHLKAAAQVVRDADGRALRMTGVNYDVTERVRLDAELRSTMTLLNAVLDSATQASIIAVRPDCVVSVFNAGAEQLLGYNKAEVIGNETVMIFHDEAEMRERATLMADKLGRPVRTGNVLIDPDLLGQQQDWTYKRKDGSLVPVSLAVTAMHGDDGALFGYLGIAHDVTEQKRHERELRHAVHAAREASRAKSHFLANMSHEIRTPLNAVIGLSYLLERTALDGDQSDLVNKVRLAGKSLLAIINDVLDLSKIEAQEMTIERAPFALDTLLNEIYLLGSVQTEAKGIGFTVDPLEDLPRVYEGDATRLQQVLLNLVNNAVKFTDRGCVGLRLRGESGSEGMVKLRFEVVDTGIGIEPDALGRLFQPFVQEDASTTRRFGGTGLGLSIVRKLVTLMGGEVGVTSAPGAGSTFWVELTLRRRDDVVLDSPTAAATTAVTHGLNGVRVLVVDDSEINREVARRILEMHGAVVGLETNGQEAVDRLVQAPEAFDVVLMDVQMPVLSGLDATRRIRSGLGLTQLPIIALTAGALGAEQLESEAAGMNSFLSKPFEPHTLVACIRRHVDVKEYAGPQAPHPVPTGDAIAWPEIAGIDTQDAHQRLGGDLKLFSQMLRRMLDDFADLSASGSDDRTTMAARMHNLKGSAGTLGAKAIASLADKAEAACRKPGQALPPALLEDLDGQLSALRVAAAKLPDAADAASEVDPETSGLALDPTELTDLLALLRDFNLGATSRFAELAPQLRQQLGKESFAVVREQIDNLQFDDAAKILDSMPL